MRNKLKDVSGGGELKGCGTFFDELCLIMIGFALGRRHRLELSMVSPYLFNSSNMRQLTGEGAGYCYSTNTQVRCRAVP